MCCRRCSRMHQHSEGVAAWGCSRRCEVLRSPSHLALRSTSCCVSRDSAWPRCLRGRIRRVGRQVAVLDHYVDPLHRFYHLLHQKHCHRHVRARLSPSTRAAVGGGASHARWAPCSSDHAFVRWAKPLLAMSHNNRCRQEAQSSLAAGRGRRSLGDHDSCKHHCVRLRVQLGVSHDVLSPARWEHRPCVGDGGGRSMPLWIDPNVGTHGGSIFPQPGASGEMSCGGRQGGRLFSCGSACVRSGSARSATVRCQQDSMSPFSDLTETSMSNLVLSGCGATTQGWGILPSKSDKQPIVAH